MSSRQHDYRRRDRSWERDDRDKARDRDRDRDRDRGRYSRRRSRSRSPRRTGTDSRRTGTYYQSIHSHNGLIVVQIDVTMEEIRMTGIPGSPVGAMNESDETQLGRTEKKTGIDITRRRVKARRARMQSPSQGGLVSGAHGWILSPGRQGNVDRKSVV